MFKSFIFILLFNASFSYAEISKKEVKEIFSRLETIYKKDFKKRNLKIAFKIKKDDRVNAAATTATLNTNKRLVFLFQGYINHRCQTRDSVTATLCHELGHHLASQNKNTTPGLRRYVVEGEADYFAAKECLPKYYRAYPQEKVLALSDTSDEILEYCADSDDYDICQKVLTASFNKVFCSYKFDRRFKLKEAPSFKTPSDHITPWTVKYHPSPQCRLDTHLAGYFKDSRPVCWFRKK